MLQGIPKTLENFSNTFVIFLIFYEGFLGKVGK